MHATLQCCASKQSTTSWGFCTNILQYCKVTTTVQYSFMLTHNWKDHRLKKKKSFKFMKLKGPEVCFLHVIWILWANMKLKGPEMCFLYVIRILWAHIKLKGPEVCLLYVIQILWANMKLKEPKFVFFLIPDFCVNRPLQCKKEEMPWEQSYQTQFLHY